MRTPLPHRLIERGRLSPRWLAFRPAGQRGFSLVELLMVMALLLVIMSATYGIWLGLSRTYAFTEEDMSVQQQSRAAMGEMVEFIRTSRQPLSPADPAYDAAIVAAEPFSLTLWTDVDRDENHTLELVRFRVSPDPEASPSDTQFELLREVGDAATCSLAEPVAVRLVSSNVANSSAYPLFTYKDASGLETTDVLRIRQVEIDLRIDVDPSSSPVVNVLSSVVQPRNLRQ